MNTSHGRLALVVALAVALFFVPFLGGAEEGTKAQPARLKVLLYPYLSSVPMKIAQEEGYLREQNLEVEFLRMRREESVVALAQGDLDVAVDTLSVGVLNAIARGSKLRVVAGQHRYNASGCTTTAVLARLEVIEAGRLKTPEGLKGLRISTKPMTGEAYYLDQLFRREGVSLDDLTVVSIPTAAAELAALEQGGVDLVAISQPWVFRILQTGRAAIWKSSNKEFPEFQFSMMLYGPNLLEKRPEVGRRFMVAYLKGVRQYNEGKTERNLEIAAGHTGLEPEVLKKICWPTHRNDGRVNMATLLGYQDWAVARGYLDTTLDESQIYDPTFVEHANRVLDQAGR